MSFYFIQKPFEQYGKTLINYVNLEIEVGARAAIVGDNGIGKSTLLKALHEKYKDEAYLMEQDMQVYETMSGLDFVLLNFPEVSSLRKQLETNVDKISDYIAINGYEIEQNIITQAKRFQLSEQSLEQPIGMLSGGQQTSIALLRAFMSEKALILLDEPTNHLDQYMIENLIREMNKSQQTIVFISHHRGFINQTANYIFEITKQCARKFHGNYNQYQTIRNMEIQTQAKSYEKQQKEIKALEATMQRIKEWYTSAHASASVRDPNQQKKLSKLAKKAKTKETQIKQKLDKQQIKAPMHDNRHYHFNSKVSLQKRYLLRIEDLTMVLNHKVIYQDAHFEIKNKENILLTGPNGSGKSLLIALIRGICVPDQGRVHITPSLKIAYFDQQNDCLNYEQTPLEMVLELDGMTRSHGQTILASFGFGQDKVDQQIGTLSMGEKSRLQFVLLFFSNPQLLILDEPTNYFDIATQDLILGMIKSFDGQVLIVTHDTYLQSRFDATHWKVSNRQLMNVSLNNQRLTDTDETLKLLDDFKDIDENGHFETDN
ncbi:Sal family ABC-F type ribosomal protection protein [Staphylococcus caeli]|uniref:Sal family ABC-F type ribosomal protection protein n=1 Tax=Staphylococcus caeli TaxID=2201815 RepID=UPI003F547146